MTGVGMIHARQLLGRSGPDDPAASVPAFRTQVDDMIRAFDHIEIVLDDDHGVVLIDQAIEHPEQFADVVEVQTGGGFVQDVEGPAGAALGQFAAELDPLGLAAGKGRGRLTEPDVAQPHVPQGGHFVFYGRNVLEKLHGLADGHVQNIGNGSASIGHLEGVPVVPAAAADVAGDIDIGQEMHFDLDDAVAFTGFAPASFDIEGEPARLVAAGPGLGEPGEQVPDMGEDAGIGGRIGARGPADRALIDVDDLVDPLQSFNPPDLAGLGFGPVKLLGQGLVKRLDDQGRFSRSGHAGHTG